MTEIEKQSPANNIHRRRALLSRHSIGRGDKLYKILLFFFFLSISEVICAGARSKASKRQLGKNIKKRSASHGGGETVRDAAERTLLKLNRRRWTRSCPGAVWSFWPVVGAEMVAGSDNPVILYTRACVRAFSGGRAEVVYGWTAPPTDGRSSPTDAGRRRHRRR